MSDEKPRSKREPDKTELVEFTCSNCGHEWQQNIYHYGIIRCKCGKFVWALQPKRGGPLKGFMWPGDPATLRNRY